MTEVHAGESQVSVRDDPDEGAYVVEVDGNWAGKAVYHMRGGRHFFVHTEVAEAYEGKGVGTKLVRYALDDVRAKGGIVVPICPFFLAFLKRHPEYGDIVDHELLERVNRAREES